MLLLDALYINKSGGLRLLEYLVRRLQAREVEFMLLADSRCKGLFDHCRHVLYADASMLNRRLFYKHHAGDYTKVLCFGNIPAPVKLAVPVYTYFHNINLLTLQESRSFPEKMKSWLKRAVFIKYKKHTDYWLVQTSNTANELIWHLKERQERVKLMPFYELPESLADMAAEEHGSDYVYISTYVPGKGHEELLDAWRLLHRQGIDRTLHLTVPLDAHPFVEQLELAGKEGVNIVNHGLVSFDEVMTLYLHSKAIIYPSHNESLGLGIVEALTAGCDVIASDLPFIHSVCRPSEVFKPYQPDSIAEAVARYEKGQSPKSGLTIHNHIDELLELLSN